MERKAIFNVDFIFEGSDVYIYRYTCFNYGFFAYVKENIFCLGI